LIVTDSSAKYLLDTIVAANVMHSLKVYSDQAKFNITTIDGISPNATRMVQTFYQVLPDHWNINQSAFTSFRDPDTSGRVHGTVTFYNIPSNASLDMFDIGNASSASFDGSLNLTEQYYAKIPYHASLLFPREKLYRIYDANRTVDSVDLSRMDTALTHTYQKSTPLSITFEEITIFERKDDLSSAVRFWNSFSPAVSPDYDVIYPSKGSQQFMVDFYAVDGKGNSSYTTQFSDTLQSKLDFIDPSYYNINMKDSLHFNISFPKTLPSYYDIQLGADHLRWRIYLPPAKNSFDAGENLVDLSKSITLKGMDNSKLQFGSLLLANGDNMNYADFYNYIFASDYPLKNRFREWQYCLIEKLK
ncbi:MAG TPA: hypothetical protein VFS31_06275, partial [Chitinophagaceae bacterium]|nr:hypothetical protein [Chitinophagaceae bacterium]